MEHNLFDSYEDENYDGCDDCDEREEREVRFTTCFTCGESMLNGICPCCDE